MNREWIYNHQWQQKIDRDSGARIFHILFAPDFLSHRSITDEDLRKERFLTLQKLITTARVLIKIAFIFHGLSS